MTELERLSRRCWAAVRAGLGLARVPPRFETSPREGRKLGDHTIVRRRAVLLDEHLCLQLKPGDDVDAALAEFVARLQDLRPVSCGPMMLPALAEHTFRMWCPQDSCSIRCVRMFVLTPTDGGEPGMRTRFDILVATKPRRRRHRRV